jgi:hypothetical protein
MPDRPSPEEAEFRFTLVNRRAKLLELVQDHSRPGLVQVLLPIGVAGLVLTVLIGISSPGEDTTSYLLLLLVVGGILPVGSYVVTLNKRLNALVHILQEDGVLQRTPATAKLLDKQ